MLSLEEQNVAGNRIRIAFIGAGGIAGLHMRNLSDIEGVEFVGFNDVAPEKAETCAAEFGGKAYKSAKTMIERAEPDAVYICVPPHCHGRPEKLVCEARLPVFIEKPVSNNLRQAQRIAEWVADAGILNSVDYHWRYLDITKEAQQRLQGKTIGMVVGYWVTDMPMVPWWRRMDQSGGQLVEQCTHVVDQARYLCGEITKVYAAAALRSMHDVDNTTVPDVTAVTVEFASGAVGTIHTSCLAPQGGAIALNILTRGTTLEFSTRQLVVREQGNTETFKSAVNGHNEADKAFIAAVRTRDQSLIKSNFEDAMKTLAVTLAANKSFQTGRAIKIDHCA